MRCAGKAGSTNSPLIPLPSLPGEQNREDGHSRDATARPQHSSGRSAAEALPETLQPGEGPAGRGGRRSQRAPRARSRAGAGQGGLLPRQGAPLTGPLAITCPEEWTPKASGNPRGARWPRGQAEAFPSREGVVPGASGMEPCFSPWVDGSLGGKRKLCLVLRRWRHHTTL